MKLWGPNPPAAARGGPRSNVLLWGDSVTCVHAIWPRTRHLSIRNKFRRTQEEDGDVDTEDKKSRRDGVGNLIVINLEGAGEDKRRRKRRGIKSSGLGWEDFHYPPCKLSRCIKFKGWWFCGLFLSLFCKEFKLKDVKNLHPYLPNSFNLDFMQLWVKLLTTITLKLAEIYCNSRRI